MNVRAMLLSVLVVAGLTTAVAEAADIAAALPLRVPDALGVNIHFTDPKPGEMEMLAAGGFRWIRMDFSWGATEREPGKYDFRPFERLLTALDQQKVRALFILDYSNRHYDGGVSPHTDEGRRAFARWAAAAVQHFQGRGILWEMYNEPNIGFWKPKPNPPDYVKLALEVGKAIRAAAPGEFYIGPATSQIDLLFLEECFRGGLLEYWDAVTVHPYRQTGPETAAAEYAQLRRLIAKYAPPGKHIPILSAEWGYSVGWGHYDADRQGRYLPRQWLVNLSNDVPLSIWYDWHDDGTNPKDPEHHFGTVAHPYFAGRDPVYDPKPAYRAAQTLAKTLAGCRFNKRLDLGDDSYVLLFQRDAGDCLAAWTTAAQPRQVRLPLGAGQFQIVGHLGETTSATAGADGLELTLTDAPQYIVPAAPSDALRVAAAWQRAPLDLRHAAPHAATLRLAFSNPLARPLRVEVKPGQWQSVAPGGLAEIVTAYNVQRRADQPPVAAVLNVEGLGRFVQRVPLAAENPLDVSLLPAAGKSLGVQVENPTGDAFRGMLKLTGVEGLRLGATTAAVELAPGQQSKLITLPLDQPPAGDYRFGVLLTDAEGNTQIERPTARYRNVDDFGRLSAESLAKTWRLHGDGDAKAQAELTLTREDPAAGRVAPDVASLKLGYHFQSGWKFARVAPINAREMPIAAGATLGLWVYGDGNGCLLRLRFIDATGQCFQPSGPKVTWKGWRFVTLRLAGENAGHWGGANDGQVHEPIRWDTLLLVDRDKKLASEGALYIAGPMLIQ